MIYIIGIMMLAIVTLSGVASCEHQRAEKLGTQIEANKLEAKRQLDAAKVQGKVDAEISQKDYDEKIRNLAVDNLKYAGQLRDPGRRNGCPSAASTTPSIPQEPTTGSELSSEAGKFLRSEADRADIAATYAAQCREFALKPSIRQQVLDQRGKR